MKRVLLWTLRGFFILFLIFICLIALDSFFVLSWLTDKVAFSILIVATVIHIIVGIIRIKRNSKFIVNVSDYPEIGGNTKKLFGNQ